MIDEYGLEFWQQTNAVRRDQYYYEVVGALDGTNPRATSLQAGAEAGSLGLLPLVQDDMVGARLARGVISVRLPGMRRSCCGLFSTMTCVLAEMRAARDGDRNKVRVHSALVLAGKECYLVLVERLLGYRNIVIAAELGMNVSGVSTKQANALAKMRNVAGNDQASSASSL